MSSMDEFNLQFYNVKKEKKSEKKTVCTAQKDKKDGKSMYLYMQNLSMYMFLYFNLNDGLLFPFLETLLNRYFYCLLLKFYVCMY